MNDRIARRLSSAGMLILGASVAFGLFACAGGGDPRAAEIKALVEESSGVFNSHDIEKYATYYSSDFIWDNVSVPMPISRADFVAALANKPKADPTVYHYQDNLLVKGDVAFYDGCSFINTNPATGKRYRTYHSDIATFAGRQIKSYVTFADGAAVNVALGLIAPPLPTPPLPGARAWPVASPEPTKLAPAEAHQEFMTRWNRHDPELLAKMLSADARILFSVLYDPANREAFIAWWGVMLQAFPDLNAKENRRIDFGDGWLVSEVQLTGTNSGPYLGNAATGKPMDIRVAWLGHYDNQGLADQFKLYYNSLTIMNQLGLKPVSLVPVPAK
jgi:ketosteroid isomerase-like protein